MKIGHKHENGFCLTVAKGKDHNTKVPPLASDMLHLALKEAGVLSGTFTYQVTGTCNELVSHARHKMVIAPGRGNNLRVHMKCGKANDSTVTGLLFIPSRGSNVTELGDFAKRMSTVASRFNDAQWAPLWSRHEAAKREESVTLTVGESPEGAGSEIMIPQQPVTKEPVIMAEKSTPVQADPSKVGDVSTPETPDDQLATLLVKIMEVAGENGVFVTTEVKEVIHSHYSERSRHGLVMGRIWKLQQFGWIRRVLTDTGDAWQVAEKFLRERGLPITITPLPEKPAATKPPSKAAKKAAAKRKAVPAPAKKPSANPSRKGAHNGTLSAVKRLKSLKEEKATLAGRLQEVDAEIASISESLSREDLLKLLLG
jgi:hypothetical protein